MLEKIVSKKREFFTSMTGVTVVMIAQGIVVPHINLKVLHSYGLLWVSLLTMGFMLARATASIFHASLYNTFSARFTGFFGIFLFSTCYIFYTILPTSFFPIVRILEGFAAGIFWPLLQSLLAMGVNKEWRSRMMSVYFIIGTIAGYVGYQIGSLVYKYLTPGFITLTGLLILYIYMVFYLLTSPSSKLKTGAKSTFRRSTKDIFREFPKLKKYIPFVILNGGVSGLMKDFLFAYVAMVTGYSEPVIRNYWSVMGYLALAISLIFAHLYESKNREKEVLWITSIFTLSVAFIPLIKNPAVIFIILALIAAGTRTLRPILRGIASKLTTKPEYGIALVNSISNFSSGIVPFIVAVMSLL